jgi:hypothetical protein
MGSAAGLAGAVDASLVGLRPPASKWRVAEKRVSNPTIQGLSDENFSDLPHSPDTFSIRDPL